MRTSPLIVAAYAFPCSYCTNSLVGNDPEHYGECGVNGSQCRVRTQAWIEGMLCVLQGLGYLYK